MNDTPKKISTKIYRPILEALEEKLEAACLRRDAYLNKVLEVELPYLDKEGTENSSEAQQFIANRLDQLDRKQISLALRPDLVERLNEICARKRIVRDAFFNRLFFLLLAHSKGGVRVVSELFFNGTEDWREWMWEGEDMMYQALTPLAENIDPFWLIHLGFEILERDGQIQEGEGIYSTVWSDTKYKEPFLLALSCYLPNEQVPDHPETLARRKKAEDFLASLLL